MTNTPKYLQKSLDFVNFIGSKNGIFILFFIITLVVHISEWIISSLAMSQLMIKNGVTLIFAYGGSFIVMAAAAGIQFGCAMRIPHVAVDLLSDRKNVVGEVIQLLAMVFAYYMAFKFLISANLIMDNVLSLKDVIDVSWVIPESVVKEIVDNTIQRPTEYQFAFAAISVMLVKLVPIFEIVVSLAHVNIEISERGGLGLLTGKPPKVVSKPTTKPSPTPPSTPVTPTPVTPPTKPTPPPSTPPSNTKKKGKGKQVGKL